MRPGPYVMLAVSDTGSGLRSGGAKAPVRAVLHHEGAGPRHRPRPGRGVRGIIKQSSGHIWVYSEPGRGTTFKIYFPEALESIRPDATYDEAPGPMRGGTETVLVIEDEPALLVLTSSILAEQGYATLEAGDGAQALALATAHDGPLHLVLADVVLPGLKGTEVAERIKALRPAVKVAFMSGYTDNALGHHHGLPFGAPFLQKPFTPDRLSR
ncbi:MAG: response regulator [Acidobacteria bacterium]|nr:response regulator [Acidobacteriota bacterium]